jgi:hypothetical protein
MPTRRKFLLRTTAAGVAAATSLLIAHAGKANASKDGPKVAHAGVVETVLGPIDSSRLGFSLPHEHIADGPYYLNKWPEAWGGRAEFVAKAVEKLKLVRAAGISTIVDLTTYDVWRDIRFLEEWRDKIDPPDGMLFITRKTIPYLTQLGVSQREIHAITVGNPKRIFGRSKAFSMPIDLLRSHPSGRSDSGRMAHLSCFCPLADNGC